MQQQSCRSRQAKIDDPASSSNSPRDILATLAAGGRSSTSIKGRRIRVECRFAHPRCALRYPTQITRSVREQRVHATPNGEQGAKEITKGVTATQLLNNRIEMRSEPQRHGRSPPKNQKTVVLIVRKRAARGRFHPHTFLQGTPYQQVPTMTAINLVPLAFLLIEECGDAFALPKGGEDPGVSETVRSFPSRAGSP